MENFPSFSEDSDLDDKQHNQKVLEFISQTQQKIHSAQKNSFKRNPVYLGVFIEGHEIPKVRELCLQSLEVASSNCNSLAISKDLDSLRQDSNTWTTPADPHVTTLFVGRKALTGQKQLILDFFEKGKHFPYTVHAVVYVPGKIFTGITFLDRTKIEIDNKFDHMTLMCAKGTQPVWSNDILEACFDNSGPGYEDYLSRFQDVDPFKEYSVRIKDQQISAYLIIPTRLTLFSSKTTIINQ